MFKKIFFFILAVVFAVSVSVLPSFALSSGAFDSGYVAFAPEYIKASNSDGFYTYTDVPLHINDPNNVNNNVLLSMYGATNPRVCYKSILTQSNYYPYSVYPSYGSNALIGRVQCLYSSIAESGDYFGESYDFFPLEQSSSSSVYSSPFNDQCSIDYHYSDIYVDLSSEHSSTTTALSFRAYFRANGSGTLNETAVIEQLEGQYVLEVDLTSYTTMGYSESVDWVFPSVVGGVRTASNGSYQVDLYFDVYGYLKEHALNNSGVVKSNDISFYPSINLRINESMFQDFTVDGLTFDCDSYLFGFNSGVVDPDSYVPLVDSFKFDNNVNLNGNDFIDWVFDTASSVLSSEFIPGIALGGLLAVVVGLSLGIWVLKVFAGG